MHLVKFQLRIFTSFLSSFGWSSATFSLHAKHFVLTLFLTNNWVTCSSSLLGHPSSSFWLVGAPWLGNHFGRVAFPLRPALQSITGVVSFIAFGQVCDAFFASRRKNTLNLPTTIQYNLQYGRFAFVFPLSIRAVRLMFLLRNCAHNNKAPLVENYPKTIRKDHRWSSQLIGGPILQAKVLLQCFGWWLGKTKKPSGVNFQIQNEEQKDNESMRTRHHHEMQIIFHQRTKWQKNPYTTKHPKTILGDGAHELGSAWKIPVRSYVFFTDPSVVGCSWTFDVSKTIKVPKTSTDAQISPPPNEKRKANRPKIRHGPRPASIRTFQHQ